MIKLIEIKQAPIYENNNIVGFSAVAYFDDGHERHFELNIKSLKDDTLNQATLVFQELIMNKVFAYCKEDL